MTRIIIETSNQAVRISTNGDGYCSSHLVNTRRGIDHPDVVCVNGKNHSTEAGARRWAAKQLAKA